MTLKTKKPTNRFPITVQEQTKLSKGSLIHSKTIGTGIFLIIL